MIEFAYLGYKFKYLGSNAIQLLAIEKNEKFF